MILENKNVQIELLYSAYGFSVYGKVSIYKWTYDGSGRTEKCLADHITINNSDNNQIYDRYLGNNVVFMRIFDKNIDNILWYLNHETVDNYGLDKIIQEALIENSNFFSHRVEQRKQKEKQEEENRKRVSELERIENIKKDEIKAYCKKKNLYCRFIFSDLYVFKIKDNDRIQEIANLLDKVDGTQLETYIDYANKCSSFELQLIYAGYRKSLDTLFSELKEVA